MKEFIESFRLRALTASRRVLSNVPGGYWRESPILRIDPMQALLFEVLRARFK